MGDSKTTWNPNYRCFDAMTTEQLEQLLRADLDCPEEDALAPETILYILDVLAPRGRRRPGRSWPNAGPSIFPVMIRLPSMIGRRRRLLLPLRSPVANPVCGSYAAWAWWPLLFPFCLPRCWQHKPPGWICGA